MPDWLPPTINLGFLVFFGMFCCAIVWYGGRDMWGLLRPILKQRGEANNRKIEAEAKKIEAEATLADKIGDTQESIAESVKSIKDVESRMLDTMGIHGETLRTIVREVRTVKGIVLQIWEQVGDGPTLNSIDTEDERVKAREARVAQIGESGPMPVVAEERKP